MSEGWISKEDLAAWHEAGHALVAWNFGLKLHTVTLDAVPAGTMRPRIAPMVETCELTKPKLVATMREVERHVVFRLAGVIGELLRTQKEHAARYGLASPQRLSRKWLMKLRTCDEPDLDFAYATVFAWLSGKSDPEPTLVSLWGRTERLLREPKNRWRLTQLAERLMKVRQMTGEEIQTLFA